MALAIDVGNSAVKVAAVRDGNVGKVFRHASTAIPDAGPLATEIAAPYTPNDPIVLVSVVPAWIAVVHELAARAGRPVIVADITTIPLPITLSHPERIGPDRILAAWTARELHGAPAIVVDLGTATTIDAVNATGAFVGGVILPGPELQSRALATGTAQLPRVAVALPDHAIGRDTVEAIQIGVVGGHVEAIAGLVRRIRAELSGDTQPKVIVTGGGAKEAWARRIEGVDQFDPELVLRGLGLLAERAEAVPR
jgi:type III pantothenate kinase